MNSSAGHRIGDTHLHYVALSSTNRQAVLLLSKTRPRHGTVISASFQWAGLGQIGRKWSSAPGKNLLCSVILYPQIPADQQFQLSMAVALATRQTLAELIPAPVTIKWPNDLYAGDAKIGGILIQNTISGKHIQHAIAGVGVNVNQETFPADLPNPTSLFLQSGKQSSVRDVLRTLLAHLHDTYALTGAGADTLLEHYLEALYRRDLATEFIRAADHERVTGTIKGVDPHGKLLVDTGDGLMAFGFNEIRMLVP